MAKSEEEGDGNQEGESCGHYSIADEARAVFVPSTLEGACRATVNRHASRSLRVISGPDWLDFRVSSCHKADVEAEYDPKTVGSLLRDISSLATAEGETNGQRASRVHRPYAHVACLATSFRSGSVCVVDPKS